MYIKIYQIDAFAEKPFEGNPAAVCILTKWLPDGLMQNIAAENNLAETAFAVKNKNKYEIRWFTPTTEVDLCGHATLATAFVLFKHYETTAKELAFFSIRSGLLHVRKSDNERLTLDFPVDEIESIAVIDAFEKVCGIRPIEAVKGKTDYLFIFETETDILYLQPNLVLVAKLPARGIIVTAKGDKVDFVSRFFAPQSGINEDPVTGSAHTTLAPYWSNCLDKEILTARQLSERGGNLYCEMNADRVLISGSAVQYLVGEITV